MNKKGLITIGTLALLLTVLSLVLVFSNQNPPKGDVTLVTVPAQDEAMENEQFTVVEYIPQEIEGTNVALEGLCEANGYTDVYPATCVNDGTREGPSYWEGPAGKESILTLILQKEYKIHTIRVSVNPSTLWGKRVQTFSVLTSMDGENFEELVAEADYEFDPKTGNEVIIQTGNVEAKYVRLVITKNTGAVGGQIAELEVYAN